MSREERTRLIDAQVFRTITSADWREAFRQVRRDENVVRKRIQAAVGSINFQIIGPVRKDEPAVVGAKKSNNFGPVKR